MLKLLRSNLLRLVKSKPFYIAIAIHVGMLLLETFSYYFSSRSTGSTVWPDIAFKYTAVTLDSVILIAVVCSLFIGSDYENGTVRNKLIIGHSRIKVYLANLITVIVAALCMNIAAMLVFYPITVPLLGKFVTATQKLLTIFFVGNLISLVYAALFTLVAMATKNTVASLIITVGAVIVMNFVGTYLVSEINAPLTVTTVSMNEFGEMIRQEVINPNRKSDGVLAFFKVLVNLFPSGQTTVLGSDLFVLWQVIVSSVCLFVGSAGAGLAIFYKSNLK